MNRGLRARQSLRGASPCGSVLTRALPRPRAASSGRSQTRLREWSFVAFMPGGEGHLNSAIPDMPLRRGQGGGQVVLAESLCVGSMAFPSGPEVRIDAVLGKKKIFF